MKYLLSLLLLFLLGLAHGANFNDFTLDAVNDPNHVGQLNQYFRYLYKGKLDLRPRDIIPTDDETYDLGSAKYEWDNVYTRAVVVSSSAKGATITTENVIYAESTAKVLGRIAVAVRFRSRSRRIAIHRTSRTIYYSYHRFRGGS
jgi:hypothetical protein